MKLRRTFTLVAIALAPLLSACGGESSPPPKVAMETAGTQIRRVATRWGDTVEEGGFLENDPHGVLEFHVVTSRSLTLGDEQASLRIERNETFKTKVGGFRCKAQGTLSGSVVYTWQAGEAQANVMFEGADLPRRCDPPAFPVLTKSLGPTALVLVLRSDRLIGRASARDRTVLLPSQ